MPFRRSSDDTPGSSRWRCKHREFLAECGLPSEVIESDRSLLYVLLHGDDAFGTGWQPDWISHEQADKLLAFLEKELGDSVGYDLVRGLHHRIGSNAS